MQKQAVPFKQKPRKILSKKDVLQSDLVICLEKSTFDTVAELLPDGHSVNLEMLASYHPDKPSEIGDPISRSDPKSYETCYWMVYKAMRELVKKLKETSKPKRIKVNIPDTTIFTSSWQKQNLSSPEIHSSEYFELPLSFSFDFPASPDTRLCPPENPSETEDTYKILPNKRKSLQELNINFESVQLIPPPFSEENPPTIPPTLILTCPQLSLEDVGWSPTPPVYKGGDIFDDIKRVTAAWRR